MGGDFHYLLSGTCFLAGGLTGLWVKRRRPSVPHRWLCVLWVVVGAGTLLMLGAARVFGWG